MGTRGRSDETVQSQRLGPPELAFIAARVSETGWPYVQYRGGPAGFLSAVDDTTLGFADFRGNGQYITAGNVRANDRVSLSLMDYAHRQRLKIFGRMRIIDVADDPALTERACAASCSPARNVAGMPPKPQANRLTSMPCVSGSADRWSAGATHQISGCSDRLKASSTSMPR
jgi:hypothetical protein